MRHVSQVRDGRYSETVRMLTTPLSTALLELPPAQFSLIIEAVIWAIKHTMRDIAEIGLNRECSCHAPSRLTR
jgi:hypothetical protein